MTKKLYYDSSYLTQWNTTILETVKRDDGYYVILEETAFYPHGGGQPCDYGYIQDVPVLDVFNEGEHIFHKLERVPEEMNVACSIDWNRRFDHMQQHSGQHLLSAVCWELVQAMTLSFHLGTDYCTIDVEAAELNIGQLDSIEREVNRRIYKNHSILSYWVSDDEVKQLSLVKQPKVTENIRIVEIKDVEHNACGGTHLHSTGEIGMIKLLRTEKHKGNTRIYFKCGYRALEEFNDCQQILGTVSAKFNTGKDEIMDRIEKWEKEQKQLQAELAILKEKDAEYTAQQLLAEHDGNLIARSFEDKNLKELQSLAAKITPHTNVPVLLATAAENKVVLSQKSDAGHSCGAFFKEHLGNYNGKGGGSPLMAQAGFPTWEDAHAFYEFTKRMLKNN